VAKRKEPQADVPGWRIAGDWFDLCTCAIGCPCVFGSSPTPGYCEGVLSWAAGLMLLLFAVAVMDLRWVAALAVLVTAEKLLRWPMLLRHAIGAGMVLAGLAVAAGLPG
jgi:hypothetical protein